jgi:hypothetical protein
MLNFIVMLAIVTVGTRIYINKFEMKGKNLIALVISFILTVSLNLIQWLLKILLDFIF